MLSKQTTNQFFIQHAFLLSENINQQLDELKFWDGTLRTAATESIVRKC